METGTTDIQAVDYGALLREAGGARGADLVEFMCRELPYACRDAYLATTSRPTEIVRIRYGTFEYVFDDYTSLEARGAVPYSEDEEGRLVVALGQSAPSNRQRDDYRLKEWVGPTERTFGKAWDKGHYFAHSLGGTVDGLEANVFVQRRDLNRGWSPDGKCFMRMEKYCRMRAGTFCFARPVYLDGTARPAFLEFGLLKENDDLWVERFDNRPGVACATRTVEHVYGQAASPNIGLHPDGLDAS